MALGGGTFYTQNKALPGAYINFVSAAAATAELSSRGIATMPLELDWGPEGEVFTVTSEDFRKSSAKIFGYGYNHNKMKGLRDLFRNINTLHAYRLNTGGTRAKNDFATAKYPGIRGNDLSLVIQKNADKENMFDVKTVLGTAVVDMQTVATAASLTDNDYVTFKADAVLAASAGMPFAGGVNGTATGASYQSYLDQIESYTFNAIGIVTTETSIKSLVASFCRRMRDEMGIKFQAVIYRHAADYMGVVNVKNRVTDAGWAESSLVYWVTGVIAGCAVNASNQNKIYDGEFSVDSSFTQTELVNAINTGEFVLHRVNADIRVLEDINSMVTVTDTEGVVFKDNQTVRIIDQLANDDAVLFHTKYLGVVPNNASGRTSLWSDLVKIRRSLQDMGAIEDFSDSDVTVEPGAGKRSVVVTSGITVISAMSKLYMTVTVA